MAGHWGKGLRHMGQGQHQSRTFQRAGTPPPQSLQPAPVQLAAPPSVQGQEGSLSGQVSKSWHLQVSSQPLSTPREPGGDRLCMAKSHPVLPAPPDLSSGASSSRQDPHLGLTQQQGPGLEHRDHHCGPAPVSQLGRVLNALRVGAPRGQVPREQLCKSSFQNVCKDWLLGLWSGGACSHNAQRTSCSLPPKPPRLAPSPPARGPLSFPSGDASKSRLRGQRCWDSRVERGTPHGIHGVRTLPHQDSWCVHHRAHCKGRGGPPAEAPCGTQMAGKRAVGCSCVPGPASRGSGTEGGPEGGAFMDPRGPLPGVCPTLCLTRCRSERRGLGPARAPLRTEARFYHGGLEGTAQMHILKPGLGTKKRCKKKKKKSQLQVIDLRRGQGSCRRHSRWDVGAPAP